MAETRKILEQLLKQQKDGAKEKKVKKADRDSEIVENLERSLTKDDPLLESNTYNGETEKNLKNLRNSQNGKENKDSKSTKVMPYRKTREQRERKPKNFRSACAPSSGNKLSKRKTVGQQQNVLEETVERKEEVSETTDTPQLRSLYEAKELSTVQPENKKRKSVSFDNKRKSVSFDNEPKILKSCSDTCRETARDVELEKMSKLIRQSTSADVKTPQNLPIRITVQNVDSASNVFRTIWENNSESCIDKGTRSGLNFSNLGTLEKSRPSLSKKNSLQSNLKHTSIQGIEKDENSSLYKVQTHEDDNLGKGSMIDGFILDGSQSEPDMLDYLRKCLADQFYGANGLRDVRSEQYVARYKPSSIGLCHDNSSDVSLTMRKRSSVAQETEQVSSAEELVVLSDEKTRKRFWREFWKRNGVELTFLDDISDEDYLMSYINNEEQDESKKSTKGKKKKVKKNEDEPTEDETAVYASVKKPMKKPRKLRKKGEPPTDEKPLVEAEQDPSRPSPTPHKANALEVKADVEPQPNEEETTPLSAGETVPKTVVRRKKRMKKRDTTASRALPSTSETPDEPSPEIPAGEPQDAASREGLVVDPPPQQDPNEIVDDGTILGVTIHHCDHIRVDPKYVAHPVVKVSIVNGFTGKYYRKFDSTRHVSSFYEGENVECIVPLMTQPYDFRRNRSLLPRWEELLIFNEPFTILTHHFTQPGAPNPIIFFVIRDFVTMAKANNKRGGNDQGWHNVAWAFLKLISSNGKPNAGRKMRLQLFYPPQSKSTLQDASLDPTHDWWLNHPRKRYPGTLFITVKPIVPPLDLESSIRSLSALQKEEGAHTFNELNESLERAESERNLRNEDDDLAAMEQWSRLPGQTCKIPNAPFQRFWAGSNGAFMVRFSHKGTKLAAACRHEETYPILLFSIPSGDDIGILIGHQQLVYDLQWSKNDRYLLTASADGTAQIWDMEHKDKPIHTLPHPCYVYTASFHPAAQHLIATGGYDSIIRVWNSASVASQLSQELDGHKAIVNSIIFDSTGLSMFSADASGVIICWDSKSYEKAKKNIRTNWSLKAKIEDRDLAGICINSLHLHPHNYKIVIHCRDSSIRLLDTRIHSMKKFLGLLNYRQLVRSSITPCGSFIFSGSEDGSVYVWNVETGDQVAIYNELGYTNAVHAVAYHPHDHLVVFCSYAPNQPILLYKFNSAVATMEAGFKVNNQAEDKVEEPAPTVNAHITAAKTAVNLERVKHKLDSVLVGTIDTSANPFLPPIPRGQEAHAVAARRSPSPFGYQHDLSYTTWGSTFDSSQAGTVLGPSYLSPHASPDTRQMAQQYIKMGRQDQTGSRRPGVSAVGGSPYRDQSVGIPPDVSFSTDKDGNPNLSIITAPGTRSQSVVVVLFEYQANRSDELTVARGDVIRVLYKDSANWWFGEKTSDGTQGYFPSNYVEEQAPTGDMKQTDAQTPVFGVPEPAKEKKVYALKMPSGRLNFYSQSESEGDDERLSNASASSRQRRREARLRETLEKARSTPSPRSVTNTPTKPADPTFPKSILQKSSPRPKVLVQTPSAEGATVKEVSFADEKKGLRKPKAKQKLLDSIQAVISKTDPGDAESVKSTTPSATPTQQRKARPKPAARSPKSKPVKTHEETTFTSDPKPEMKTPRTPSPTTTSNMGILKSVQALMQDKSFSQSVVGGPGVSTPKSTETHSVFRPAVHSTALKKPRTPVENVDPLSPSFSQGSVIRKARQLSSFGKPPDEESIPMVKMGKSKNGRGSPAGVSNPAFDTSP